MNLIVTKPSIAEVFPVKIADDDVRELRIEIEICMSIQKKADLVAVPVVHV